MQSLAIIDLFKEIAYPLPRLSHILVLEHIYLFAFQSPHETFRPRIVVGIPAPAYIIGARCDLLAWNQAAIETFRDFSKISEAERNTLYQMFTTPDLRKRFPNWEKDAREMLENFRASYDLWADSAEFNGLVERISSASPEFKKWWKIHGIRVKASGEKIIQHERLGKIKLRYSTFQLTENPDLKLVLYGQFAWAYRLCAAIQVK